MRSKFGIIGIKSSGEMKMIDNKCTHEESEKNICDRLITSRIYEAYIIKKYYY